MISFCKLSCDLAVLWHIVILCHWVHWGWGIRLHLRLAWKWSDVSWHSRIVSELLWHIGMLCHGVLRVMSIGIAMGVLGSEVLLPRIVPANNHLLLAVGCCWLLVVVGCWLLLAVGCWMLVVVGCWLLLAVGCCWLFVVGCSLLLAVVCCWLLVVGCWLLLLMVVVGCCLWLAVGCCWLLFVVGWSCQSNSDMKVVNYGIFKLVQQLATCGDA